MSLRHRYGKAVRYLDFLGAWDDHEVITLSEDPSQCDLPRCGVVGCGYLFDTRYDIQNFREILLRISEVMQNTDG